MTIIIIDLFIYLLTHNLQVFIILYIYIFQILRVHVLFDCIFHFTTFMSFKFLLDLFMFCLTHPHVLFDFVFHLTTLLSCFTIIVHFGSYFTICHMTNSQKNHLSQLNQFLGITLTNHRPLINLIKFLIKTNKVIKLDILNHFDHINFFYP